MKFCRQALVALTVCSIIFSIPVVLAKKKSKSPAPKAQPQPQPQAQKPQQKKELKQAQQAQKPPEPQIPPPDRINYEQIDAYVKYYAGLGLHRAGSRIDRRAAHWIKTELKRDKLDVSVETYTFKRPVSRYAVVSMKIDRLNSVILPGMPLFNAKPTNHYVNTKLGFVGQKDTLPVIHIYVTPTSGNAKLRAKSIKQFKDAIESGKYRAVIGVTQGGYAGLVPLSIDLSKHYKTPAMLMSSEIGNFAEIYAEINNPVKFLTRLQYKRSTVQNVIGVIKGTDPTLAPIVVLTPRSAWWYAAAGRGAGVATFLSAADALAKVKHLRSIYFVSTSGQEYYSMGVKKFLDAHPDLVNNTYAWIYLGGSVGTKPVPHYILQGSSRKMRRIVHRTFERYGVGHLRWLESTPVVIPALTPVFGNSDRAIIIAATNNRCARMTCDKWPSNVNIEVTTNFAKSITALIQNLAAQK